MGAGSLGKRFYDNLRSYPDLVRVYGFFEIIVAGIKRSCSVTSDQGLSFDQRTVKEILSTRMIDEVILALPLDAHDKYPHIIEVCEKASGMTIDYPDFFDYLPGPSPFRQLPAGMPMINAISSLIWR